MQNQAKTDIGVLVRKIVFVLATLFLIRCVFLWTNRQFFASVSTVDIILSVLYGSRLDLAVLLPVNSLFLLFALIFPQGYPALRNQLNFLFFVINTVIILLAVCDNVYFSYTQHRMSYGLIYVISGSFTWKLVFVYIFKGWYWIMLLCILALCYRKLFLKKPTREYGYNIIGKVLGSLLIIISIYSAVRGFEARPLSPSTALLYFPAKLVNLTSNTGFNIAYSFYKGQRELQDPKYFTKEELDRYFQVIHNTQSGSGQSRPNIVLFVMESFARDFLDRPSPYKAYTPFLDSLMNRSLVFTNAFSNGNESTHGMVSILASLPPFMQVPYYHSPYHATAIHGIGEMLSEQQYDCSFFLGDVDDSFGFREFTNSLGIKHYYSRKDFGNDSFYNGAWGIHDDRFLPFAADVLSKKSAPFFATIFNVSSHPPYIIPADLKKRFTIPGQNAEQNSVSYVDFAYRKFFQRALTEPWFKNTVFIFIADHFLSPSDSKPLNSVNMNEIPFFIYSPSGSPAPALSNSLVQQVDVVPTILHLTGYRNQFMSFGSSVFDSTSQHYAVQRIGDVFQVLDDDYVLGFNQTENQTIYLYHYKTDQALKQNLVNDPKEISKKQELEKALKLRIQRYNVSFITNRLSPR